MVVFPGEVASNMLHFVQRSYFGIEGNAEENNHFQTCINPSVLPVRMHVFDIDTAEMVS